MARSMGSTPRSTLTTVRFCCSNMYFAAWVIVRGASPYQPALHRSTSVSVMRKRQTTQCQPRSSCFRHPGQSGTGHHWVTPFPLLLLSTGFILGPHSERDLEDAVLGDDCDHLVR